MSLTINTGHALYPNIVALIVNDGGTIKDLKVPGRTVTKHANCTLGSGTYGDHFRTVASGGTAQGVLLNPAIAEDTYSTAHSYFIAFNAITSTDGRLLGSTAFNSNFPNLRLVASIPGGTTGYSGSSNLAASTNVVGTGAHTIAHVRPAGDASDHRIHVDKALQATGSSGFSGSASMDYLGGSDGFVPVTASWFVYVAFDKALTQGEIDALHDSLTGGNAFALWSVASDTTVPTLTSPTGTQTGSTTATVGATTDEGNGTMYAVVTLSATPPSVAQIQAGQNSSGAAAAWAGNQAISSAGAKTFSATGLTASTTYYAHIQHKDAAANNSTVVTSASFTTAAGGDTTPPTLTGTITVGTVTSSSIQITWPAGSDNVAVTSYETSPDGTTWTDRGNVLTYTFTGLTASTSYTLRVRAKDAAGNVSTPALQVTQSTSAPATGTLNFQAAGMEFGSRSGLAVSTFGLQVGINYRYTVHADSLVLGAAVYTSGTVTTDSAGKLPSLSDASITTGAVYRVHAIRQSDGEAATFRMTAT